MKGKENLTPNEEEEQRRIAAHKIAKEVCEVAATFWEALYLLEAAADEIKRYRDSGSPRVGKWPIDRFGRLIKETPDAEAPGNPDQPFNSRPASAPTK